MGFLDFVQQDDRIGLSADFFGQLTAFFVAHIARRGTDQTRNGKFLHVFAHVDANQVVGRVKQNLGQLFG